MCSFIISDSRALEKKPLMINGPPAQDSPKHILNALNDFCIQKILCSLETREDLMCAAESCTRFQKNAISCFRNKFKTLIIEPKGATKSYGDSMEDEVVKRFLSIFGHLMNGIAWFASKNPTIDTEIAEVIARFCGKTLYVLFIDGYELSFPKRSRFTALGKLMLGSASPKNLKVHAKLTTLVIARHNSTIKLPLQLRIYPKLEHLFLHLVDTLTNDRLTKFLSLNPQLKTLDIHRCYHLTPSILESIATHLPNIEKLCYRPIGVFDLSRELMAPLVPYDDIMHLGRLKNLKHLEFSEMFPIRELIEILNKNNVNIEYLSFFLMPFFSDATLEYLPSLKTTKTMRVDGFIITGDIALFNLLKTQPTLEELELRYYEPTIEAIRTAFSYGERLSKLTIRLELSRQSDAALDKQVLTLTDGRALKVEFINAYKREYFGMIEYRSSLIFRLHTEMT